MDFIKLDALDEISLGVDGVSGPGDRAVLVEFGLLNDLKRSKSRLLCSQKRIELVV